MAQESQPSSESLQFTLDLFTFKELLRDLLFREAGKPYFKSFHVPRQRWQGLRGSWRPLSTYQAERALLPVGGRQIDSLIQTFFETHKRLRAEFQEGGMPVTAVNVLRGRCPELNAALEYVHALECYSEIRTDPPSVKNAGVSTSYIVELIGGAAPPPGLKPRRFRHRKARKDDDNEGYVYQWEPN